MRSTLPPVISRLFDRKSSWRSIFSAIRPSSAERAETMAAASALTSCVVLSSTTTATMHPAMTRTAVTRDDTISAIFVAR